MFYSKLPNFALGPLHFGAEEAEGVGRCGEGTFAVATDDDVECVPGAAASGTPPPVQYYSRLPFVAIGSLQWGAEQGEGIGRCGAGTTLLDGKCELEPVDPGADGCPDGEAWRPDQQVCLPSSDQLSDRGGVRVHDALGNKQVYPRGEYESLGSFDRKITQIDVAAGCYAHLTGSQGERGTLGQPLTYTGSARYGGGVFKTEDVAELRVFCWNGPQPWAGPEDCQPGAAWRGDQRLCLTGNGGLTAGQGVRVQNAQKEELLLAPGTHPLVSPFHKTVRRVDVAQGCQATVTGSGGDVGTVNQVQAYFGGSAYGSGKFKQDDMVQVEVTCSPAL